MDPTERRAVRLIGCHSWGCPMPQLLKSQLLLLAIAASILSATQLSATAAPATEFRATVLSIGDGDTLRVSRQGLPITIRLACIDAPETAQGATGAAATQTLRQLVGSGPLEIRPQTVDRYGRTVAEVYANGRNLNV